MPDNITSTCVPITGISDHKPVLLHTTIKYRSYKTFNENYFCNDICWSQLKYLKDINSIVLQ